MFRFIFYIYIIFILGPHVGAIIGVCIFQLLLKMAPIDDLEIVQNEHVRSKTELKEQTEIEIELCNIKTINEERHAPSETVDSPRIGRRL